MLGETWFMRVLVIGANGKIGRLICKQGIDLGMEIIGMVRDEEQVQSLANLGVRPVVADLEGELTHAFDGVTHVVFTAGSGGHTSAEKTLMVDLYGAVRAIDESKKCGVKHFVMISALDADNPLMHFPSIAPYMVAKKVADDYLRNSRLSFTILRPGVLTDDLGSGKVSTILNESTVRSISRQNVANCVLTALDTKPLVSGRVLDLIDGSQPIGEAFTHSGGKQSH